MADGNRLPPSDGRASVHFPWANDTTPELRHSTPLQRNNGFASRDAIQPVPSIKIHSPSTSASPQYSLRMPDTGCPVNDLNGSTVQRQRRELQLLMAELKDREKELNAMSASQHKQLLAWEQDRHRMLALERRCARLNEELQKRNEVIRVLTQRVLVVETREEEVKGELGAARRQLSELEHEQQRISRTCEGFEDQNQSLNSTVVALSSQVGSLQVREEELSSMLKLKEQDVTEASSHIVHLTGRLRDLETSLSERQSQEKKLLKDLEENKKRYRETKRENLQLNDQLKQQLTQSSMQREEIIRLKQELQLLHRDLLLSGEGDSWKDELLELARSKQERTTSELRCLRQVCETQRNDLQLLHINLESAHETLRERASQCAGGSQDELTCGCPDKRSPSSLRMKNSRLLRGDATPRGAANAEPAVFSAQLWHDDAPLSSSSLQRLLEESRQVIMDRSEQDSSGRVTSDNLYPHKCQQSHIHPATPTQKVSQTPPKACPRHQSDSWTA